MPSLYLGDLTGFDIKSYSSPRDDYKLILPMANSTLDESFEQPHHPLELKILFYTAFIVSLPLTVLGKFHFTAFNFKSIELYK